MISCGTWIIYWNLLKEMTNLSHYLTQQHRLSRILQLQTVLQRPAQVYPDQFQQERRTRLELHCQMPSGSLQQCFVITFTYSFYIYSDLVERLSIPEYFGNDFNGRTKIVISRDSEGNEDHEKPDDQEYN